MKKKIFKTLGLSIVAVVISGCASTDTEVVPEKKEPVQIIKEEKKTPEEPVEIDADKEDVVKSAYDEEYSRSTTNVMVTKEKFEEDKTQILKIIDELAVVMKNQDYFGWLKYLDENSKDYWSKKQNLQKASNRLPKKGFQLKSLQDYFKYVFIPSRVGRTVDEIRYETETQVKVVQTKNNTDMVYYNFLREDGKWKLRLPPIND
ncbi:MAG: hypothetical protein K6B17_04615 [Treponema sp.]|nr:hypothetical protein [Treponema sp.]